MSDANHAILEVMDHREQLFLVMFTQRKATENGKQRTDQLTQPLIEMRELI